MARIVFISLYDEFCHGMRMLTAELKTAGHHASLICFKQYKQVLLEDVDKIYEEYHVQVVPSGDQVNSYSYAASDIELDHLVNLLQRLKPDLVGFGYTTTQKRVAAGLTSLVKGKCGVPVIHGGPYPTTCPEECLRAGADYACRGEADEAIVELANSLDAGEDPRAISNLVYIDDDGQPAHNPLRPLILDLDELPYPDYSADNYYIDHDTLLQERPFPESQLNTSYIVITARGCSFHCSFCYVSVMQDLYYQQKNVRERSLDHVMGELKQALAWRGGHCYFELMDSIFTLKPQRIQEFCERHHREIDMPFWCYTHPACARVETIRPLAECPNCEYVVMGIQSGSKEIGQRVFHRNHGSDLPVKSAEVINKLGVRLFVDMITNVPGETDAMCRENLDLLRRLPKPWSLRMTKLSLFPEHKVRDETQASHCVESKRYRLWNALYFLAQNVDLADGEVDAILENPMYEAHPEILEKITTSFDNIVQSNDDARAYLRVEKSTHQSTQKRLEEAETRLEKQDAELAEIKYRKGYRHFIMLSDALLGGVSMSVNGEDVRSHRTGRSDGNRNKAPVRAFSRVSVEAGAPRLNNNGDDAVRIVDTNFQTRVVSRSAKS